MSESATRAALGFEEFVEIVARICDLKVRVRLRVRVRVRVRVPGSAGLYWPGAGIAAPARRLPAGMRGALEENPTPGTLAPLAAEDLSEG